MTNRKRGSKPKSNNHGLVSDWRSRRNIEWIEEYCHVPDGHLVGQKLKLPEFMREDLRAIYDNPHRTRRAIISRGRKNAKTTESALIVLLHLVGPEALPNSEIFSAAQSREQASVLFGKAAKIIRFSPRLSAFVTIRDTAKQLFTNELGITFRALSADASTAYGLNPSVIIHDELGQVKGPSFELYQALETATAAQEKALSIIISTQAPTDGDLLSILIDDALSGADPRTVIRLNTVPQDSGVDIYSEEAIRMANPAYDSFMVKSEVLDMAEKAKRIPTERSYYRNLMLNQRVEINDPFISRDLWETCLGGVAETFGDAPVYAGLDLSENRDLTAFVMIANVDDLWQVKPIFWLPSEGLSDKSKADHVPYNIWADQGYLETTPGRSVEYEYVADYLFSVRNAFNLKKIAFDRWNFKHLKPWLLRAGFGEEEVEGAQSLFTEFGQGFQSMSPALRTLEGLILNQKLRHDNHPVLSMCAANAKVQGDQAGNRKLSKMKSHGRIDGMVALAMAVGCAGEHTEKADSGFDDYIASLLGAAK